MSRDPIPVWCFAIVIVRRGDQFLLVQENKPGQPWYLPAGRIEPGESFAAGAVRETWEEGGIRVRLTGILRINYTPDVNSARMRVVFVAEPLNDTPPKSVPDDESLRARWVRISELSQYTLRGTGVPELLGEVATGGVVYPLDVLQFES